MYFVCTASEPCFTGFQGVQRNANMQVPDAQQPAQDNDRDRGDPCPEDDQDFDRPDAATMEAAISWFMDGMDAQERSGFKRPALFAWVPASANCKGRSSNNTKTLWKAVLSRL